MIQESSFTTNWYTSLEKNYRNLDHNLLDKVTHALYLLENITDTHLKFVFKGGTCLLLLLREIKRFSLISTSLLLTKFQRMIYPVRFKQLLTNLFSPILKNNYDIDQGFQKLTLNFSIHHH